MNKVSLSFLATLLFFLNAIINTLRNDLLKRQRDSLLSENERLKEALAYAEEESVAFDQQRQPESTALKEAKLLKQMIRTIEEKNLKEKNLLAKKLQQRVKEVEHAKAQLEKVRLSERHLQSELRTLSAQLRMSRHRSKPMTTTTTTSLANQRSSSLESLRRPQRSSSYSSQKQTRGKGSNFIEQNRLNLRNRSTSPAYSKKSNISPSHSIDSICSYNSLRSNDSARSRRANSAVDTLKKANGRALNNSTQKRYFHG